ncbi:hypothetical protein MLD52_20045 [Puniceicoccaceae bacterium K14]|nr:hypothetical protein [Puniceicoccaceae bacterium K14]
MSDRRFHSLISGKDLPKRKEPLLEVLNERWWYSREAVVVAVLLALLSHIAVYFFIPEDLFYTEPYKAKDPYKEFSIELAPEEEIPEDVYSQTNPDEADNEPDETNRFAARNQQAANEKKAEELDPYNRPASESEDDVETDQILSGELEPVPYFPPQGSDAEENVSPQHAQSASAGLKKAVPILSPLPEEELDQEGIKDHNYEVNEEEATNVTELFEGEDEEGEDDKEKREALDETPQVAQSVGVPIASPKPRPKLPRVAPGPVRNSSLGVSNTGNIAVDAKFSQFGEYVERLIEVVSIRWNTLADQSAAKERNSYVKLKFKINSDGVVEKIELLDSTSKFIGISICRTAIQSGSPYGEWSQDMIEVLGYDEEVTFSFHYR